RPLRSHAIEGDTLSHGGSSRSVEAEPARAGEGRVRRQGQAGRQDCRRARFRRREQGRAPQASAGRVEHEADPAVRGRHQDEAGGRPRQAGLGDGGEAEPRQGQGLRRQAGRVLERPAARHVPGRGGTERRPGAQRRKDRRGQATGREGAQSGEACGGRGKAGGEAREEREGQEVGGGGEVRAREGQEAVTGGRPCSWAGSWGGSGRRGRRPAWRVASCCWYDPRRRRGARRAGWWSPSTAWRRVRAIAWWSRTAAASAI